MSQNLVLSFEPQQLVLEVINTILEVAYFHLVIPSTSVSTLSLTES
jgi:hypothetical protein